MQRPRTSNSSWPDQLLHTDKSSPLASFSPDVPGVYVFRLVVNDGCSQSSSSWTLSAVCNPLLSVVLRSSVTVHSAPYGNGRRSLAVGFERSLQYSGLGTFPPVSLAPLVDGSVFPPWATAHWTLLTSPTGSIARFQPAFSNSSDAITMTSSLLLVDVPGSYILQFCASDGCSSSCGRVEVVATCL
jgi:hypothetical protein